MSALEPKAHSGTLGASHSHATGQHAAKMYVMSTYYAEWLKAWCFLTRRRSA